MESQEALSILKSLTNGKDPFTQQPFEPECTLNNPNTLRALFLAVTTLEQAAARQRKRTPEASNSGKTWSPEEDERLARAFDSGVSTKLIASEHRRSLFAIHSRLIRLGKIKDGEVVDGVVVQRSRFE